MGRWEWSGAGALEETLEWVAFGDIFWVEDGWVLTVDAVDEY